MIDLIKKALYTGVGLAVLTKEKAEELVQELTQAGEALGARRKRAVRWLAQAVGEVRGTIFKPRLTRPCSRW